jgi:hypothetical protein
MKIDFRVIFFTAFAWLLSFVLLMWVFSLQSCSPTYHLNKFYKKGGKIEDKKVEVFIRDTISINGRDSIIEKSIYVDCPEPKAPETRYEIRWKYKTKIDSFETIRYQTKYKYKTIVKEKNTEVKTNPIRQIKSLLVWAVVVIVGLFVFNWISKK